MISFTPTQLFNETQTPGGATFQSHNRLVARTSYGYFFSYIYKQTSGLGAGQSVCLFFSPTGLAPYTLLDSYGIMGGGAPAVLADELGDIYWLISDDSTGLLITRKYIYSNGSGGMDRIQKVYNGLTSTKWTGMYSEHWHRIYTMSFYTNTFSVLDQNLNLVDSYVVTQNGSTSGLEYPFLVKDQDEIVLAWVTVPVTATSPFYDGIHFLVNNNGGTRGNWYTPQDGIVKSLPIVSDNTGPSPEMRQGFTPTSDSVWLDACTLTNRLNFHYTYADPNGPSPVTQTEACYHSEGTYWGRLSLHDNLLQGGATSKVGGSTLTIQSKSGSSCFYFKGTNGLFLVGVSNVSDASGQNWINVLKSTDDGLTWQDFAQSSQTYSVYGMNGFREGIELSGGGYANGDQIIGMFTHYTSTPPEVYSFVINT